MLNGLYWEYMYNDGSDKRFICPGGEEAVGPCPVAPEDRNILYENRLLGLPRFVKFDIYHNSQKPSLRSGLLVVHKTYQ